MERLPSSGGISPLKSLSPRSSTLRLERLPSSAGISPLNSLWVRCSCVRLERRPAPPVCSSRCWRGQLCQVGEAAQLRRYLPAQVAVVEPQRCNAPVVVGGDAVPFAEGSVAQPVVACRPVLTVRCVVEGNQGFPVRFGGGRPNGGQRRLVAVGRGSSVAVGAAPDPGVEGVRAGEVGVSVGVDAVRSGTVTPDGSSEPQAASAAVRARARTTLKRVTYLVVRVLVIFLPSRFACPHLREDTLRDIPGDMLSVYGAAPRRLESEYRPTGFNCSSTGDVLADLQPVAGMTATGRLKPSYLPILLPESLSNTHDGSGGRITITGVHTAASAGLLPPPACKQRPWELHLAVVRRLRRLPGTPLLQPSAVTLSSSVRA